MDGGVCWGLAQTEGIVCVAVNATPLDSSHFVHIAFSLECHTISVLGCCVSPAVGQGKSSQAITDRFYYFMLYSAPLLT